MAILSRVARFQRCLEDKDMPVQGEFTLNATDKEMPTDGEYSIYLSGVVINVDFSKDPTPADTACVDDSLSGWKSSPLLHLSRLLPVSFAQAQVKQQKAQSEALQTGAVNEHAHC